MPIYKALLADLDRMSNHPISVVFSFQLGRETYTEIWVSITLYLAKFESAVMSMRYIAPYRWQGSNISCTCLEDENTYVLQDLLRKQMGMPLLDMQQVLALRPEVKHVEHTHMPNAHLPPRGFT